MKKFLIFTDRRGRRWICGSDLLTLFGIYETRKRHFWNYDSLCRRFSRRENH